MSEIMGTTADEKMAKLTKYVCTMCTTSNIHCTYMFLTIINEAEEPQIFEVR